MVDDPPKRRRSYLGKTWRVSASRSQVAQQPDLVGLDWKPYNSNPAVENEYNTLVLTFDNYQKANSFYWDLKRRNMRVLKSFFNN